MVYRVIAIIVIGFSLAGCGEDFQLWSKHFQSSIMGLRRRVSHYAYDGKLLQVYEGRFKVEGCGTHCNGFILDDGRKITMDGGITVVEELK